MQVLLGALTVIWVVEVLIARGPSAIVNGPSGEAILTTLLFSSACGLGFYAGSIGMTKPGRVHVERPLFVERFACLIAIGLSVLVYVTGLGAYDPTFASTGPTNPLGIIWAPVALGCAASILASSRQLVAVDWLLLVGLIVSAGALGGRTVPGSIGVMILLRAFVLLRGVGKHGRVRPLRYAATLAAVGLVALALSYIGAARSTAMGNDGYSESSLAGAGYTEGPLAVRYLTSTLGVIGEAAKVTHAAVPHALPYSGAELLMSDLLSATPWFKETVTERTISVFSSVGLYVFVSHPGGTPTTFFLLGGRVFVVVGGFIYGLILMRLAQRSVVEHDSVLTCLFLILAATFFLGAYGTGTPTSNSVIAFGVASGVKAAAWISAWIRQSVAPR